VLVAVSAGITGCTIAAGIEMATGNEALGDAGSEVTDAVDAVEGFFEGL
jgi:hypothetical protein